uniref:maleylacetoacetate isomerase n=1 Tax=Caenorhabditis tropicalis TaxID=1561998 RepID=A0A1I7USM1_9PELO
MSKPILYSSWSSSCSSRVRIALALKKIDYEYHAVNLRTDEEQKDFALNNPAKKVPILKINGLTLTESMSIIEYLDEVYPNPPLLPKDPEARAHARAIAFHISSNIQPLQNLAICRKLEEIQKGYGIQWCHDVICRGFDALEQLLKLYSGRFCVGDRITIADLVLPSIVYNATEKYNVDMGPYPIISRIAAELGGIPEFEAAHPSRQPDAPKN